MNTEIKNHFLKEFGNDIQITTVEFETKTGTLTMTVEDLFNWVENCHKAEVNSVTDSFKSELDIILKSRDEYLKKESWQMYKKRNTQYGMLDSVIKRLERLLKQ